MNFGWYLEQFSFKGRPVSGGTVEFFVAGSTTTPKNVWYDADNTVIAPNPITLDASGTMPQIYPESGLYLIVLRDASGAILYTRDNVSGNEGGATDADLRRFYSWFMMDSSYTGTPPDEDRTKITVNDVQTMLEFGYCCTGNTQTTSTTTTSLWYVKAYDATNDIATWKEVVVDLDSEIINLDRGNCNYLIPHPDRLSTSDQTFTTYPAGLYTLVKDSADGFYWKPQVVKEYPEPSYTVSGALIYDASLHAYRWLGIDELGGKVKVDANDSTAGYLADKLVSGDTYITFTKNGADNTNKTYKATLNINNVYDEIISKMNPPSYDLFGAYPDEVGVCQLTGIGASLKAKDLKDSNGNPLAWAYGTGQNGANYGRSCIPGYAYVKNAQGTQVKKRVWCAFGSTGEIYNSFDRYNSTTRDTSLITADTGHGYIPMGDASCAAYILDGGNYYWLYGGFVDNYCYLLEDIPTNYNDDGTFKSTGWVWTSCPGLLKNVSHLCSVVTGGFLFTGYQLGGINYKATIAGASVQAMANPPRTNPDYTTTITANGYSFGYTINLPTGAYYTAITGTASDHTGPLSATYTLNFNTNATVTVVFAVAPPEGDVITVTISSTMHDPTYDGAGLSGLGTDHYGTYNVIDRDTGRIYTNTSEYETGTFNPDPSKWSLLEIFVRNSDKDNYPTTKVDRLGSTFGIITGDPYTWWSSIQSAYGLWVATVALKQAPNDPLYAYSDDGIHWTKYTDGIGTGTGSTIAVWDSQSDGMNWYVTNMFQPKPLIFELLVDSIPAHKRLVAEKGLGVSGDAFLVDLPSATVLGTDENGKLVAGTGAAVGALTNLDDLKNVATSGKTDGQLLYWNLADGKWEPKTVNPVSDHLVIANTQDTVPSQLVHKIVSASGAELSVVGNGSYGNALKLPQAAIASPFSYELFPFCMAETFGAIKDDGTIGGTSLTHYSRAFGIIAPATVTIGYICTFNHTTGNDSIVVFLADASGIIRACSNPVTPNSSGIQKIPLTASYQLNGGILYYLGFWRAATETSWQYPVMSGRNNTNTATPLIQMMNNTTNVAPVVGSSVGFTGNQTAYRPYLSIVGI